MQCGRPSGGPHRDRFYGVRLDRRRWCRLHTDDDFHTLHIWCTNKYTKDIPQNAHDIQIRRFSATLLNTARILCAFCFCAPRARAESFVDIFINYSRACASRRVAFCDALASGGRCAVCSFLQARPCMIGRAHTNALRPGLTFINQF